MEKKDLFKLAVLGALVTGTAICVKKICDSWKNFESEYDNLVRLPARRNAQNIRQ